MKTQVATRHKHRAIPLVAIKWFQWPNVLAVDAACVAMVWQLAISTTYSVQIHWAETMVLGLSVWLTYMGDRWLDARRLESPQTQRHHFAQRHSRALFRIWLALLLLDITVAITWLEFADLLAGCVLLFICILYTVALRIQPLNRYIPKELLVACIFSGGLLLFFIHTQLAHSIPFHLTIAAFGILVFINCTLLSKAEIEIDRHHGHSSLIQQWPSQAKYYQRLNAIVVGIAAFLLLQQQYVWSLQLCLLAALYLYLDHKRTSIHPENIRILTDSALLLPVWMLLL